MEVFNENKVINSLHTDRAIAGEKYWFSDNMTQLKDFVVGCDDKKPMYLTEVLETPSCQLPFRAGNGCVYALLYPYEEPKKRLMSNRQLAEWLVKGHGQFSSDRWCTVYTEHDYDKRYADEEVPDYYLICPWGFDSNNWLLPTEEIYLRDCKGGLNGSI